MIAGEGIREEIHSMPGIERYSIKTWSSTRRRSPAAGVGAMLLFGIPAAKDECGTGAYDDEGIVQMAVRALKEAHPDLTVITDVCLCEYTSHGHCGFPTPTARSRTTSASSCSRKRRSPTPTPAPTRSRRAT